MDMDEQTEQRIIDQLNGRLPDEEAELLDRWLQESDSHRAEFEKIRQVHRYLVVLKEDFTPDVLRKLAWVKSHRQRKSIVKRWMSYAAIGLLLLSLGGGWWLQEQQKRREFGLQESVRLDAPVNKLAYFVLADGGQVFVPSDVNDTIFVRDKRVMVCIDSGRMLHYKNQEVGVQAIQKLVVPNGGEYRLKLEDGSVVWLNSASELEFPAHFSEQERVVRLKGEGYFKIQKDTLRPFRVETEKVTVKVLGTEFNLMAYADEAGVATTLVKGAVEVLASKGNSVCLRPGQQLLSDGKQMTVREVEVASVVSWIEGKFSFQNATLQEIMQQVGRWYDVKYTFVRGDLKNIRFSGAIQKFRPLSELFRMIEATAPVCFVVKGEQVVITDK